MVKVKEFLLTNFIKSFLTLFLPFFIIISLTYLIKLSNELESEDISKFMNECIYTSLRTQSARTKRHLMDNISPTAKRKAKRI